MARVSLFALAAVIAALGVFLWRARPDASANCWFATKTTLLACWILGIGGLQGTEHLVAWGRFTFASASLIPVAFLGFTRCFPYTSSWPTVHHLGGIASLAVILSILSLTTSLLVRDVHITREGLVREVGLLYTPFVIYFVATWATGLLVFALKWRKSRGLSRAQLQYVGAGIIIAGLGGIAINLLLPVLLGVSAYSWLGPYCNLPFVALVAHAIIRHRLLDLRVVIHRTLAYSLYVGFTTTAAMLIFRLAYPDWSALSSPEIILIFTVIVLAMLTPPARLVFSRVIDPYLFRARRDYASALRDATHRFSRLMQPDALARELREIFSQTLVPEFHFLLLPSPTGNTLEPLGDHDSGAPEHTRVLMGLERILSVSSPPIIVIGPADERRDLRPAYDVLRNAHIEIVLPLRRRGDLLGVVLLGPRKSGDAYFTNELTFLESLSQLVSIALENSRLYVQRIQMLEYSEKLLGSLDSAVVATDAAGNITSSNPAAKTLLGLEHNTRVDQIPPEVSWALVLAIAGLGPPAEAEALIDHPTRGLIPVVLSTAVLHDAQNQVSGALAIVTDLSTVKALERNQRRVEHLSTMARFYAGIAHEIRNPLAAISNLISMLPDRFDDPEYRDTAARLLPLEVSRIVGLADRLRLMAPSEGGTLSPVALRPLLTDIIALQAASADEAGIKLRLVCPNDLPNIQGDLGQLVQLFLNLIKNAIEAMPQGGTVVIDVARRSAQFSAGSILVQIIDQGSGVDPLIRTRIFDPFFTTKPLGTGLGLSICREISEFHRATLSLSPRADGVGTVAQVEFPCSAPSEMHDFAIRATTGTAIPQPS